MDIQPILSALLRNRTGAILVALQVAITLAVMVNAIFIIRDRAATMDRPTGVDEAHLFTVTNQVYAPDYDWNGNQARDLDTIRGVPGVRAAGTINTLPGSNGGWGSSWKLAPDSAETFSMAFYAVDDAAIDALGLELVAGRAFREDEIRQFNSAYILSRWPESVMVTSALAERLFPGEDAVGKTLYTEEGDQSTIVGVVEAMAQPWPEAEHWEDSTLVPSRYSAPVNRYVVRVDAGEDPERVLPEVEKALRDAGHGRIIRSGKTHEQILGETFAEDRATTRILWTVIGMLVAVTALGIVGLTSFNVRQRTKQIGTRRALGATRGDILRHYMVENAVITGAGVAAGTVLTFAMNWWLAAHYDLPRLQGGWVPLGILVLVVLGQLAVLGPARRASLVSPAVATRTV